MDAGRMGADQAVLADQGSRCGIRGVSVDMRVSLLMRGCGRPDGWPDRKSWSGLPRRHQISPLPCFTASEARRSDPEDRPR